MACKQVTRQGILLIGLEANCQDLLDTGQLFNFTYMGDHY